MEIINEQNYPFLRYHGRINLMSHEDFEGLYREASEKETMNYVVNNLKDPIVDFCRKYPDAYVSKVPITAENMKSFPVFRIPEEDVPSMTDEVAMMLLDTFSHLWTMSFYDQEFEIIKGSAWYEMYDENFKGFDEWLKGKMVNGFHETGVIIRPHEKVCEFYEFLYEKDHFTELSFAFQEKELIWGHFNCRGFFSSTIEIPRAYNFVAQQRKVSLQEAYLKEEMYNILRWLHYKEFYRMKRREMPNFMVFSDKEGFTDFCIESMAPCVMYEKVIFS